MDGPSATPRRFGFPEATTLLGAATACVVLLRLGVARGWLWAGDAGVWPGRFLLVYVSPAGELLLAVSSLTLLAMAASEPRAAFRDRIGRPGMMACGFVLLAAALPLLDLVGHLMMPRPQGMSASRLLVRVTGRLLGGAAPMLLGAWLVLAASRRWRPAEDWLDRAGLLVGAGWVIVYLIVNLEFDLRPLWR